MIPLSQQPRYVAASKELAELNAALVKLNGRLAEIDAQLVRFEPRATDASRIAAALDFASSGVVRKASDVPADLQEERAALTDQLAAVHRAMRTCQDGLETIERELSKAAWCEIHTAHEALRARLVAALKDLDAVQRDELDLLADFHRHGYSVVVQRRVFTDSLGLASDPCSLLFRQIREHTS